MTREEFKNKLKIDGIHYTHDSDDNIIITNFNGDIWLEYLREISEDVIFRNNGVVDLSGLVSIPDNIIFENKGQVNLMNLKYLPKGVKFRNAGDVLIDSIGYIPSDVEFSNKGGISLKHIYTGDDEVSIKGVSDIRLLLIMEKRGLFKR
jgi:hypothetical protein